MKHSSPRSSAQPEQDARAEQLKSLLDRLDAKDSIDEGRQDRRSARATFRRSGVKITVHHPGGTSTERSVLTRDLSAGGLSFIHGGYLHIDTRCDVTLARYVGGTDNVRGVVQRCEHIAGSWHTVGVKFDRRIFPKLYLDPEFASDVEFDSRNPQSIGGRVLLVDDSELDRRLMAHHLRRTKVELTGVATLAEAVEAIAGQSAENPFRLAIVDLNLSGNESSLTPDQVVRKMVDAAVPRVAACSAESDVSKLRAAREAGAISVLAKPYDNEKLLMSMASWLGNGGVGGDEAIYSSMAGQEDMNALIEEFVAKTKKDAQALHAAIEQDSFEACRSLVVSIRGGGASFGFGVITEVASEAVISLDGSGSVADAAVALQRLIETCGRLSADAKAVDEEPRMAA
jgi:CheY-like chemotaxis protein